MYNGSGTHGIHVTEPEEHAATLSWPKSPASNLIAGGGIHGIQRGEQARKLWHAAAPVRRHAAERGTPRRADEPPIPTPPRSRRSRLSSPLRGRVSLPNETCVATRRELARLRLSLTLTRRQGCLPPPPWPPAIARRCPLPQLRSVQSPSSASGKLTGQSNPSRRRVLSICLVS